MNALISRRVPTGEQRAVIEAMSLGASGPSVMIKALAGCAKSSTIEMGASGVEGPSLALAFNKRNADELRPRLPESGWTVKTMNALGHQAWVKGNPRVSFGQIDGKKLGGLVTQVAKDRKIRLVGDQWDQLRRLAQSAMNAGLLPTRFAGEAQLALMPDSEASWESLCVSCWIEPEDKPMLVDMAREVLERDIELARKGTISFDDQVYCPTLLGGVWPKFPTVVVDEAQDLNALNHAMLGLCLGNPEARLIAVGDPLQSIYHFRGAVSDGMEHMKALRATWQTLPLMTTFRCPKVVVARQQAHAPGFQAWEGCAEGTFARMKPGWVWADVMEHCQGSETPMVLCRNNAPLLSMAFKLLRRGVGVHMLGRDIGKGLVQLSKKLEPEDSASDVTFAAKLLEWETRERSLAIANGHEERCDSISDRAECLRATLESSGATTVGGLRGALENLFARESGLATLATGHKAKGMECPVVLHLDPWRVPTRAQCRARGMSPVAEQQEQNLRYVIETRSQRVLLEGMLEDFEHVPGSLA